MQAAERSSDIELPEGAIDAGLDEFATSPRPERRRRAAGARRRASIDRQTMDDFVESGLLWREVVGARFRARATPTEADLDAALELDAPARRSR